jgi:hypothetical protein
MKIKHKTEKTDSIHFPQTTQIRNNNSISTTPVKAPSPDKHQPCLIQSTLSPIHNHPQVTPTRKEPVATSICRKIGQRDINFDQSNTPNASLPLPCQHKQTLTPKNENIIMRNA